MLDGRSRIMAQVLAGYAIQGHLARGMTFGAVMPPRLELSGLRRMYSERSAVDGVDLAVALLGPSGCGKSTTLNMIVGLEWLDAGDIRIDGRSVLHVPAGRRGVGLVFQDYAVFPRMTVRSNLDYGLRIRGVPRRELARLVEEAVAAPLRWTAAACPCQAAATTRR